MPRPPNYAHASTSPVWAPADDSEYLGLFWGVLAVFHAPNMMTMSITQQVWKFSSGADYLRLVSPWAALSTFTFAFARGEQQRDGVL